MEIKEEEIKNAQKFMIEWCEQNNTKILMQPDSALEILQCMADYKGQSLPIDSVSKCECMCPIPYNDSNNMLACRKCNNEL